MNEPKELKDKFAVSLMCMDFLNMKEQIEVFNDRIGMLHADLMDGHFCKNITLSPAIIKAVKRAAKIPIDVHLMTTNHMDWIDAVAEAGADIISPHAETINTDAFRTFNKIKDLGCQCGVVVNPATPLDSIRPYLNRIDLLTIMTIDVGFAGQPFITEMLDKITEAKMLREKYGYHYRIQIDGSCSAKTFKMLCEAGADIYIVGNAGLFSQDPDLNRAFDKMYGNYAAATTQDKAAIA